MQKIKKQNKIQEFTLYNLLKFYLYKYDNLRWKEIIIVCIQIISIGIFWISFFYTLLPLVYIQFLILLFNLSCTNFICLILIILLEFLINGTSNNKILIKELNEFNNYIIQLEDKNIKAEEVDLFKLFNIKQINYLLGSDILSNKNIKIFRLIPPKGLEIGQFKGFTLDTVYQIIEKQEKACPHIFIREYINDLTIIQKFFVFHEIGHSNKRSLYFNHTISDYHIQNGLYLVFLAMFIYCFDSIMSVILFLPCLIYLFWQFKTSYLNEYNEEVFCDAFAFELLSKDTGFDFSKLYARLKIVLPSWSVTGK